MYRTKQLKNTRFIFKAAAKVVFFSVIILFLVWLGLSTLEVIVHNGDTLSRGYAHDYSDYNFYCVMLDAVK